MSPSKISKYRGGEFAGRLLKWHEENLKEYPWRETSDPYQILTAELMLRKTTRKQVITVFRNFMRRFPNVQTLSSSSIEDIIEVIRPLGMEHVRAQSLSKIANILVSKYNGFVPNDKQALLDLPSVGPYISNAVLCIAYGRQEPLVDTNFVRVVSRVFSVRSTRKRPRTDPKVWQMVGSLLPKRKAKEFNLAILDFAESVCRARNPKCTECPILSLCDFGRKRLNLLN